MYTKYSFPGRCFRRGMTLIELLSAIAIVGVLSGVVVAVTNQVRESAAATEDVNAARQAITAYLLTPMDNNGQFIQGYGLKDDQVVNDSNGNFIPTAGQYRYVWRLAPYLEGGIEALFAGEQRTYFEQYQSAYDRTLYPSIGNNYFFVGGDLAETGNGNPNYVSTGGRADSLPYPRDMWVLRPGDAYAPSKLIVFVSTHFIDGPDHREGFFRAQPPKAPGKTNWGSYNEEIPGNMGNVHLRHQGRAVVANLDGSVELLNEEELRDMRRWSNQAAKYNEPDFSSWSRQ